VTCYLKDAAQLSNLVAYLRKIALSCLMAGHGIQPCWCRFWVSEAAAQCRPGLPTKPHTLYEYFLQ
jgi:hypothetical protein